MPRPDRSNALDHIVVSTFENRSSKIYNAIRTATSDSGSNAWNTLFLITFDEHGGTYDHVPLPEHVRHRDPPPTMAAGPAADRTGCGRGRPVTGVLTRRPARPGGWPEVSPQPVPPYTGQIAAPDAAPRGLSKAAFHACAALLSELVGDVFVRLHGG